MNVKIIPLGTVSPYCSKNNNCSGFLIKYKGNNIILDTGNGISKNLSFPSILNNLTIVISHLHKDHFGDLGSIQYASFVYHNLGILKSKPTIYLPDDNYNNEKENIVNTKESYNNYKTFNENTKIKINNLSITFHNNNSHSIKSYITKLETPNKKIVYTGDVGNTNLKNLQIFCENSDLLICESSFLRKHNANSTTHLTAEEAALIAKISNSKELMLFHFWPEEDQNLYLEEAKEVFPNTILPIEGKQYTK